jgi:hypothetical protein
MVDDQVQDVIAIYNWEKELIYLPQIQPTNETATQSRQKLKPTWSVYIDNLPNPVTLVMKSNKKMKQLLCWRWSRSTWSEQRGPIGDCQSTSSPIGNRSSLGLMMCSGANGDASIFAWIGDPQKTKDQSGRTTMKTMGLTCSIWRVRS